MTRRVATVPFAFVLFAMLGGSVGLAHEGHDHQVMGTVTMAAADHVMLKSTEGKDVTVLVTKDTKVTRDKKAMKAQDIAAGVRIVITTISDKDPMTAKEIQVGAEAKAEKH